MKKHIDKKIKNLTIFERIILLFRGVVTVEVESQCKCIKIEIRI